MRMISNQYSGIEIVIKYKIIYKSILLAITYITIFYRANGVVFRYIIVYDIMCKTSPLLYIIITF